MVSAQQTCSAASALLKQGVATCPAKNAIRYIAMGTFNTLHLYLLSFNTLTRTLSNASRIDAQGPHQYLATNEAKDVVYATTWAWPPSLSAWRVEEMEGTTREVQGGRTLKLIGRTPITATSSYVSVTPSTFTSQPYLLSAGGPSGEIHALDPLSGAFREKIQELVFVEDLEAADKTRKALRYGSHGADLSSRNHLFVPDLGRNSIWMYRMSPQTGKAELLDEVQSPRKKDAPRHVVPSKDGRWLYSVTEHTSYIDVFEVDEKTLTYRQSGSIIPEDKDRHTYRGDTLRLSRDGRFLFASTRGGSTSTKGYVAAWALKDGNGGGLLASEEPVTRFETPTSGGKANAIEPAWFEGDGLDEADAQAGGEAPSRDEGAKKEDYVLLTDDEVGFVFILGWDAEQARFTERSRLKLDEGALASHAVWLS